MADENKKSPEEASNLFHNIMKASVSNNESQNKVMTKAEWEDAYKELSEARTELASLSRDYEHGSNKKIRADADRQMGYKKTTVRFILRKYEEVYIMATGGENNTDYGRAIIVDEFFQNRYIVRDLDSLLYKIQEKIKSFDNTESVED